MEIKLSVISLLEAGPTINGFDSAKKLIEILQLKTGADAIKFQILNADDLVADKNSFLNIKSQR